MKTHSQTGPYGLYPITRSNFNRSNSIQSQSPSGYLMSNSFSKHVSLKHCLHTGNWWFLVTASVFLVKFRKINLFSYLNNSANFHPIKLIQVSIDQRLYHEYFVQQTFLSTTLSSWSKLVVSCHRPGFSRTKTTKIRRKQGARRPEGPSEPTREQYST